MNVQDRRRILGPVEAKPLAFPSINVAKSADGESKEKASSPPEFTDPTIRTNVLTNCNGSCILETPQLSLLSSIYGPKSTRSNLFESRCQINVIIKSSIFSSSELKELSSFLINVLESFVCLELYPKAGIDVFVNLNIEEVDELSWYIPYIIMSIVLGLVDAGIEISDLPGSGFNDNNVACFTKDGNEVIGIWKDKGETKGDEHFLESLEACKVQYLRIKELMSSYLLSQSDKAE